MISVGTPLSNEELLKENISWIRQVWIDSLNKKELRGYRKRAMERLAQQLHARQYIGLPRPAIEYVDDLERRAEAHYDALKGRIIALIILGVALATLLLHIFR